MKTYSGKVVSNKMHKTVVVERVVIHAHPLYKKLIKRTRRIKAHSDISVSLGDTVKIVEIRPLAKDVHFKVVERMS